MHAKFVRRQFQCWVNQMYRMNV